jgi:parallel beta-helix repeat protein
MNKLLCRIPCGALGWAALLFSAGRMPATEIKGTVTATWTIYDDSKLVGNVTCMVENGPCIVIGASHVKLSLNGFTITSTIAGCTPSTSFNDGIDVIGLEDVAVLGPGLVQKFGGFGIFLGGDSKVNVEGVTASDNCFSGILLGGTTDSNIERNVSVRNSMGSEGAPCGGT